ncbi:MAG: hypothetical protein ACRDQD_13750 [Nocardioidaceae bacterium]
MSTAFPGIGTLRFGVTIAQLHTAARTATTIAVARGGTWAESYDTAYSAIALHLYEATQAPPQWALVTAGCNAIHAEHTEHQHHHGYYRRNLHGYTWGAGSSPAFVRYWAGARVLRCEYADTVVERMAVRQIMPRLARRHRRVLVALAVFDGDRVAVGRVLGMTPASVGAVLSTARRDFVVRWFEGETPRGVWRWSKTVARSVPEGVPR